MAKTDRHPGRNFEHLWKTFHNRYPFFELREVDWEAQYQKYRPLITDTTSDEDLFKVLCEMLDPLDDGHVELRAKLAGEKKRRKFTPEPIPKFYTEFSKDQVRQLFAVTEQTLAANGFGKLRNTDAWMLKFCRSKTLGYIRFLEFEDIDKRVLARALKYVLEKFNDLAGVIIDIRDNPGGDDDILLETINRISAEGRVAFHRKTRKGHRQGYSKLKSWRIEPKGRSAISAPIILLTCDTVFSGAEVFALALRELQNVTIMGDRTNGIFSYQLEKTMPNGWEYRLSYQIYYSADMVCYEGVGVPVDFLHPNTVADLASGRDSLVELALKKLAAR
ncbi:MAG: S41 family peptidase [Rhizobiaceae bacterium]